MDLQANHQFSIDKELGVVADPRPDLEDPLAKVAFDMREKPAPVSYGVLHDHQVGYGNIVVHRFSLERPARLT